MAHSDGPDSLPAEIQLDMFASDPESVRAELAVILAKAQAALADPQQDASAVAQDADAPPSDHEDQLRLALETELARLRAA
jgi:hypothetical protein